MSNTSNLILSLIFGAFLVAVALDLPSSMFGTLDKNTTAFSTRIASNYDASLEASAPTAYASAKALSDIETAAGDITIDLQSDVYGPSLPVSKTNLQK